jgi:hypothetical protein
MSAIDCSRRPRRVASLLIATTVCAAVAGSALGQSYVQPPCQAGAAPRFEDHLQSLWYRRFWTGDCKDLPTLGCRSGKPYWNDVVHTLVARAPADKRDEVAARACRLGERIGFEWTRPKTERRIDTHDLQALDAKLDQAPDVLAGLAAVEASVKGKVGG